MGLLWMVYTEKKSSASRKDFWNIKKRRYRRRRKRRSVFKTKVVWSLPVTVSSYETVDMVVGYTCSYMSGQFRHFFFILHFSMSNVYIYMAITVQLWKVIRLTWKRRRNRRRNINSSQLAIEKPLKH